MNTRQTLIITALAVALLATTAFAQPSRGPRGEGFAAPELPGFGPRHDHLDLLDLSEEQETSIEAIRDQARDQGVELRKQQARLRNEIEGEMLADEPSQKTLIDLTEQLGALRTQLQVIRLKARLAVRAELTAEQRDRLMLGGKHFERGGLHRGRAPRALEKRLQWHRQMLLDHDEDEDDDEI